MTFTMTVDMDNAAFADDPDELARILAVVRGRVREGETDGRCMDVNGNRVGSWEITA